MPDDRRAQVNDFLIDHGKELLIAAVASIVVGLATHLSIFVWIGAIGVAAVAVMLVSTRNERWDVARAPISTTPVSDEVRRERLQRTVAEELLHTRGRVEYVTDYTAAVAWGRKVNHVLHLLLSLVTFGAWLLVWILLAVLGGENRTVFIVDECGNVRKAS